MVNACLEIGRQRKCPRFDLPVAHQRVTPFFGISIERNCQPVVFVCLPCNDSIAGARRLNACFKIIVHGRNTGNGSIDSRRLLIVVRKVAVSRLGRGRMISRGLFACKAVDREFIPEKMNAVDKLSARFSVFVCHVNQPPLESVRSTQDIRLSGRIKNIVCYPVFHVEQGDIDEPGASAFVRFDGKTVFSVLQEMLVRLQVYVPVIRRAAFVNGCTVQANFCRARMLYPQRQISVFCLVVNKWLIQTASIRFPYGTDFPCSGIFRYRKAESRFSFPPQSDLVFGKVPVVFHRRPIVRFSFKRIIKLSIILRTK